jgi:hypothetical protein
MCHFHFLRLTTFVPDLSFEMFLGDDPFLVGKSAVLVARTVDPCFYFIKNTSVICKSEDIS